MRRRGFSVGASYLLRGFALIREPTVRRFVLIPLAVNVVIFVLLISYAYRQFETLMASLMSFSPAWLGWLEWLLWPLFAIIMVVAVFFSFTLLANLIGAPFNGLLAEAVERRLTGQNITDAGWAGMLKDILPSLFSELRKLSYFVVRAVPLLILFLIPGINLLAPVLWLGFSAWMLALQYADYPMANHGLSFREQRRRLRENRSTTLGFGGAGLLATLIPGINLLVMPVAVAGATALWVEQFADESIPGQAR